MKVKERKNMLKNESEKEAIVKQDLMDHYQQYYHLAFRYMKNEADALDVVQESAYKAIINANKLKNSEFVHSWVYRIVINTALSLLKQNAKSIGLDYEVAEEETQENSNEQLERAMLQLNDQQRLLIHLRFDEEYKIEEIAAMLDLNVNTVKSKLYRTLDQLQAILKKQGECV